MELRAGDIFLYRGKGILPYLIRRFMNIYRKRKGLEKRTLYNHAAMVVKLWDQLYVAEATGKGIEVRPYSTTYKNKMSRVKILRPKKPFTKAEQELISKIAVGYSLTPHRYNYLNFLFQIAMIMSTTDSKVGKWFGIKGKRSENRLYCSEAVAVWYNDIRAKMFDAPYSINPLDIDLNSKLKNVYGTNKES